MSDSDARCLHCHTPTGQLQKTTSSARGRVAETDVLALSSHLAMLSVDCHTTRIGSVERSSTAYFAGVRYKNVQTTNRLDGVGALLFLLSQPRVRGGQEQLPSKNNSL